MADSSRIEDLKRRVQMDPASIAFAALAEEYRRSGRFEEAIATCEVGLQRHPAYLSARVTLGRSLLEIGRFDEAQEQLEHVLRVAPENLAAIRGLAEIHNRRGDIPETVEHDRSGTAPGQENPPPPEHAAPPPAPATSIAAPPPATSTAAPAPKSPAPLESVFDLASVVAPRPEEAAPEPQPTPIRVQTASVPAPPVARPVPVSRPEPAAPVREPHPDAAALPALEAFLAAIVRARQNLPSGRSGH